MKKISHRLREQAALICQIAASNQTNLSRATDGLDLPRVAWSIAIDAWLSQPYNGIVGYAEAEALLRCGWSPT